MKVTDEMLKLKAAVLRARGKNNTLHDILQAADYLEAALSAQPQTVAVKPLEWSEWDKDVIRKNASTGRRIIRKAYSAEVLYELERVEPEDDYFYAHLRQNAGEWYVMKSCYEKAGPFKTDVEAIAWCEQDHIHRIRSALTTAPAQEPVEWDIDETADHIARELATSGKDRRGHEPTYIAAKAGAVAALKAAVNSLTPPDQSARIAELEAALGFYADKEKWDDGYLDANAPGVIELVPSSIMNDEGKVARAALKGRGDS